MADKPDADEEIRVNGSDEQEADHVSTNIQTVRRWNGRNRGTKTRPGKKNIALLGERSGNWAESNAREF